MDAGKIQSLTDVNRFLMAWVEQRYHTRRHGSLKISPVQAMEQAVAEGKILSRQVEPETVREVFLWREIRQVTSISTIKIYGNQYEVVESLIGRSVEVRYNPYNLNHMLIYSEGEFCCEAKPYIMKNFTEKRVQERQEASNKALNQAMEAIVNEHAAQAKAKSGVSFARVMGVKHGE